MIPKIIHYCWFGGKELPPFVKKCIASWKKYAPDFEIKQWDESNFDKHFNRYVSEAYEAKKYAFVSDVARLFALVNEGGLYFDTDVELLKPIDDLTDNTAFLGFENNNSIGTAVLGSEPHFPFFECFLNSYQNRTFITANGSYDTTTNVKVLTDKLIDGGLIPNNTTQVVNGISIYTRDYFSPKDFYTKKVDYLSPNSVCVHHFDGSWMSFRDHFVAKVLHILGPDASTKLIRFSRK